MNVRSAFAATLAAASLAAFAPVARAVGQSFDVQIVDRTTGQALPVYKHGGRWWVAGTPGSRYAVRLVNTSGGRALAVLSVDGVNAVTGETAAPDQAGYVLAPGATGQITGWRKDLTRVAAFEFTSLDNAYATRTGRPENVGVIGVAVFRERERAREVAPPVAPAGANAAPSARAEASRDDAGTAAQRSSEAQPTAKLGTGHGRSESSPTRYTDFERAQSTPNELIAIHYDSRESLIARGVIPRPQPTLPNPFPGVAGFVPDPR